MWLKRTVRRALEFNLRKFGGSAGKRKIREISYSRDGIQKNILWATGLTIDNLELYDYNFSPADSYCPICDGNQEFKIRSDKARVSQSMLVRKVLYCCSNCNYLFSEEKKGDRNTYFDWTQAADDLSGHRGQREADLVNLAATQLNFPKDTSILIYAVGKNQTVETLKKQGYTNIWSCDVADNPEGGATFINIAKQPDYFRDNNLCFDIITAVEVWEHYERHEVNPCFKWIYNQVSSSGVVLSTPSIWRPTNKDPYYNGFHEWGNEQLNWWHYPYFPDHGSFYSEDNLLALADRNGFEGKFAYFQLPNNRDPFKQAMISIRKGCEQGYNAILEREFVRKFHSITY